MPTCPGGSDLVPDHVVLRHRGVQAAVPGVRHGHVDHVRGVLEQLPVAAHDLRLLHGANQL